MRPWTKNHQHRQGCKFSGPEQKVCVVHRVGQLFKGMVPLPGHPIQQLPCSMSGEINQDLERHAISDARFASYSHRYFKKDNEVVFPY